jgi:hypothetical protein
VNDLDVASSAQPILSYVNTWVHNHLPLREPEVFGTEDHGDADYHLCRDFVFGRTGRASESLNDEIWLISPKASAQVNRSCCPCPAIISLTRPLS